MIDPKQLVFSFLEEDPRFQQERQTALLIKKLMPKLSVLLDRKSEEIVERVLEERIVSQRDLLEEVTTRLERIEARLTSYDRALRSMQSQIDLDDADWWKRGSNANDDEDDAESWDDDELDDAISDDDLPF